MMRIQDGEWQHEVCLLEVHEFGWCGLTLEKGDLDLEVVGWGWVVEDMEVGEDCEVQSAKA